MVRIIIHGVPCVPSPYFLWQCVAEKRGTLFQNFILKAFFADVIQSPKPLHGVYFPLHGAAMTSLEHSDSLEGLGPPNNHQLNFSGGVQGLQLSENVYTLPGIFACSPLIVE